MLDGRFSQRLSHNESPPVPPFTASYLSYRIHNAEDDPARFPRLRFLRAMIRDLVAENETLDFGDCAQFLCSLIAEGGVARIYQLFCPALSLPKSFYEGKEDHSKQKTSHGVILPESVNLTSLIVNIFVAAAVTNTHPIVERYISLFQNISFTSILVPDVQDFYRLVARYADPTVMSLLLSGGNPSDVIVAHRNDLLAAAAVVGRLPAAQFIHDFGISESPWNFKDRRERYPSRLTMNDALFTPSKDVWDYIIELRERYGLRNDLDQGHKTAILSRCVAEGGDATLVEHLLDLGASADTGGCWAPFFQHQSSDNAVLNACVNGDEDIVRVFLARNADTDSAVAVAAARGHLDIVRLLLDHGASPFGAILRAAKGGYMGIVRMLLDAGVDAEEADIRLRLNPGLDRKHDISGMPIVSAIEMEHTEMAVLLRASGVNVSGDVARECVKIARKEGLESMLDLLREWGIDEAG